MKRDRIRLAWQNVNYEKHHLSKGEQTMSEKIIQLYEGAIKQELSEVVSQSVEDTLNAMLDEEADRLTNGTHYERSEERLDTRTGHNKRKLQT